MEAFAECSQEGRDDVLYYLLHMHPGRTLVFLNTISSVRRIAAMLKALDINAQVRAPPCSPRTCLHACQGLTLVRERLPQPSKLLQCAVCAAPNAGSAQHVCALLHFH